MNLTKEFIVLSLRYLDPNHLRYYKCFLNLYYSVILDIEPLLKISEYENKCFLIEDVIKFFPFSKSFNMFKEICFSSSMYLQRAKKEMNVN